MKIELEFGRHARAIPKINKDCIINADDNALRLLLIAAVSDNTNGDVMASELGLSKDELNEALKFWQENGFMALGDEDTTESESPVKIEEKPAKKPTIKVPKRAAAAELPIYTTDELTYIMQQNKSMSALIIEAQNVLGKMFNVADTKIIAGMADDLGFSDEYILMLLSYCRRIGKTGIRYIEKMSAGLYDKGITTEEALSEHIAMLDAVNSVDGQIRKIFGTGARAFTSKEVEFISNWVNKYGYGTDMISKAYETTVDAISKPSFSYANKIIESWYAAGYKTISDVENAKKNEAETKAGTSFNAGDFLEAAIKRSYTDK